MADGTARQAYLARGVAVLSLALDLDMGLCWTVVVTAVENAIAVLVARFPVMAAVLFTLRMATVVEATAGLVVAKKCNDSNCSASGIAR